MSNTPNPVYEKLMKCYESFRSQIDFQPEVALILGSGLGDFANDIRVTATLDYHDIEGFPVSTVPGHAGRFIFGYVGDVPVVCMQGRVHYYEGYPMTDVVLPTRLMKLMGAKALFLTNAAGGIKQGTKPGSLMLLNGQIACFVPSPLIGPNIDELGTRFPDMSQIYDLEFQKIARKAAASLDIDLMEGVYLQLTGPQYESPQEIAMCRTLGADAVQICICICIHRCNACSEEKCKDENLALLTYMLQHNEHHAAELDEMADKLEKAGMADAAKQIREGVSDFQKGNMRLSLALTLVKEHLKEVK